MPVYKSLWMIGTAIIESTIHHHRHTTITTPLVDATVITAITIMHAIGRSRRVKRIAVVRPRFQLHPYKSPTDADKDVFFCVQCDAIMPVSYRSCSVYSYPYIFNRATTDPLPDQ